MLERRRLMENGIREVEGMKKYYIESCQGVLVTVKSLEVGDLCFGKVER